MIHVRKKLCRFGNRIQDGFFFLHFAVIVLFERKRRSLTRLPSYLSCCLLPVHFTSNCCCATTTITPDTCRHGSSNPTIALLKGTLDRFQHRDPWSQRHPLQHNASSPRFHPGNARGSPILTHPKKKILVLFAPTLSRTSLGIDDVYVRPCRPSWRCG